MAQVAVHPHAGQVKLASGLDVLAAIWLFISAFVVPMQAGISWSNALVAIAIGILAFVRTSGAYGQAWMSWLNAILGLWVFFSQWIIARFVGSAVVLNNLITGGAIIVLALWSGVATTTEHTDEVFR